MNDEDDSVTGRENGQGHAPYAEGDPFVELIRWLIDQAGGKQKLAHSAGIRTKTLTSWLRGDYPKERNSLAVSAVHEWACRTLSGEYPGRDLRGHSLLDLSGPDRLTTAEGGSSSALPDDAGGRGGADLVAAPKEEFGDRQSGPKSASWKWQATTIAVFLIVVVIIGAELGWFPTTKAASPLSSSTAPSTITNSVPTATAGIALQTAANHLGSPVYKDSQGSAVPSNVPNRIPYGTVITVSCRVSNQTGIRSVTALYRIAAGMWQGFYTVSDTFTNGDPLGSTGPHAVDSAIPTC
jgi:hypothetical protein